MTPPSPLGDIAGLPMNLVSQTSFTGSRVDPSTPEKKRHSATTLHTPTAKHPVYKVPQTQVTHTVRSADAQCSIRAYVRPKRKLDNYQAPDDVVSITDSPAAQNLIKAMNAEVVNYMTSNTPRHKSKTYWVRSSLPEVHHADVFCEYGQARLFYNFSEHTLECPGSWAIQSRAHTSSRIHFVFAFSRKQWYMCCNSGKCKDNCKGVWFKWEHFRSVHMSDDLIAANAHPKGTAVRSKTMVRNRCNVEDFYVACALGTSSAGAAGMHLS